ncbi:hypothetical protein PsYK624_168690 [Phanerochaete sordida]|uniref:Uncharacterized protein n=1 Tax=Phanerochaete sordida TaxID=48140 RepID=A0A9P3GXX3_9APHY|nr:hypothetical protein PsYK624_168690 [Phanerochaete sordida]
MPYEGIGSQKTMKRHLGQYSLVCRYWARHCRAPIFAELELRTREDARRLLAFARTTTLGTSIGAHVRELTLSVSLPTEPWVHLAMHTLPRALFPQLASYTLRFTTTAPAGAHLAPRSVFAGLPRTLPAPRHAPDVHLDALRFGAFAALVAFVDSLLARRAHGLAALTLADVAWADGAALRPHEVPRAFRGARRRWGKHVLSIQVLRHQGAAWPLLWLLVAVERARPAPGHAPLFVDAAEMCRIVALVQIVLEECKCTLCESEKEKRIISFLADPWIMDNTYALKAKTWPTHQLLFRISSTGFVKEIKFTLAMFAQDVPRGRPPAALHFDWSAVDTHVGSFPGTLGTFRMALSDEVYDAYEPYVRGRMPRTDARGLLHIKRKMAEADDVERHGRAEVVAESRLPSAIGTEHASFADTASASPPLEISDRNSAFDTFLEKL